MAEKDKKYYWLKLKRDFFKRHDIQIIEDMPNGKDYILFYLKLLCESVDHDGHLRFNDEIPYNEEMLATITRTNVDIVRSAVKVFSQLQMIEIFDDGTLYMREVQKMLGCESYWAERSRVYRERQKQKCLTSSNENQTRQGKSIEIEKDLDKEKEKEKNIKKKTASRFHPPTIEEVKAYCEERGNNINAEHFVDYYTANGWVQGKGKPIKDWKASIRTWERSDKAKPVPKQNGGTLSDMQRLYEKYKAEEENEYN